MMIVLSIGVSALVYKHEAELYKLDRVLDYKNFTANFTVADGYFFKGNVSLVSGLPIDANCSAKGSCSFVAYMNYNNVGDFNISGNLKGENLSINTISVSNYAAECSDGFYITQTNLTYSICTRAIKITELETNITTVDARAYDFDNFTANLDPTYINLTELDNNTIIRTWNVTNFDRNNSWRFR